MSYETCRARLAHVEKQRKEHALRISELEAEVARLRECCIKQSYEVRQSLAIVLYGDLESAGEHVAETLALEAAEKIKRLTADERLRLKWGLAIGGKLVMTCVTNSRAYMMAQLAREHTPAHLGEVTVEEFPVERLTAEVERLTAQPGKE